jgi:hypothetical protein
LSSNKNRQAFGITKQQGNELLLLSFNDDGVCFLSRRVVWLVNGLIERLTEAELSAVWFKFSLFRQLEQQSRV